MRKLSPIIAWSISIILALLFVAVGSSKLLGPSAARWGSRFSNWGFPVGFQYVVGGIEIISGVSLLFPRSRRPAAASLMAIMAGAICTHVIHAELRRLIPPLVLGTFASLLFFFHPATEQQRSTSRT